MTTSLLPWRRNKTGEGNGFIELQQAMNKLFEDFSFTPEFPALLPAPNVAMNWNPRLDVTETEKDLQIVAELPGLEEKDVEISLNGDALLIKGEKRGESEEKGKTFHRIERTWGSFQRLLPLPCEVDRNNIKAVFSKGLLTVTLPKTEAAKQAVRKIPIKSA